jgi:hypothetical protein
LLSLNLRNTSSNRFSSHSSIDFLFIAIKRRSSLDVAILKHIDSRARKLARADPLLEEQIELGEGAALGLGQAEVGVNDT